MLYREIIAVSSEIHTKHINTLCGQNVELLNVKLVVHIVTAGLWSINIQSVLTFVNSFLDLFISSCSSWLQNIDYRTYLSGSPYAVVCWAYYVEEVICHYKRVRWESWVVACLKTIPLEFATRAYSAEVKNKWKYTSTPLYGLFAWTATNFFPLFELTKLKATTLVMLIITGCG
jgi:hypothetical protein